MAEYIFRHFERSESSSVDLVKKWWEAKVGAMLSDIVLSDYGYMLMSDEGEGLVATFLYPIQGCSTAMIGFPISNPMLSVEERRKALHLLTTCIENEARKLNYKFLISYAGSEGAKVMFGRLGYKIFDTDVTNFGKVL